MSRGFPADRKAKDSIWQILYRNSFHSGRVARRHLGGTATTDSPRAFSALAACAALAMWSVLFSSTYRYSFYWDDFHFIRPYSTAELLSTLHGPTDPDRVETPALRPLATAFWAIQGSLVGDNVVLQRIGMAVLMAALLFAVGLLLTELGLTRRHIIIVFGLFVASRVFASLILWISLGTVILGYLLYVVAVFCSLRWMKDGRRRWLLAAVGCAIGAVLTREEALTLPLVVTVLGGVSPSSGSRDKWRGLAVSIGAMMVVVSVYLGLRALFVQDAPRPQLSGVGIDNVLTAIRSSWRPGGYEVSSRPEALAGLLWDGFVTVLTLTLVCFGRDEVRRQCVVACVLGFVLCLPAVGVLRPFGVALPTIAFMSAIALATVEMLAQVTRQSRRWLPAAIVGVALCLIGVLTGVVAGLVRSRDVAAALHENCARKVLRDGGMLFDLHEHPVTIPTARRAAGLARLASLGITSPAAWARLRQEVENNPEPFRMNYRDRRPLFLTRHDYLSF